MSVGKILRAFISFFRHRQMSLRFAILSIFISLYLLTAFVIIVIRTIAFEDEMRYISRSLMHHASDAVYRELIDGIKPVEVQGNFTAELIQNGVVSQDQKELPPYLFNLVNAIPLVRSAFWGDKDGNFIVARKEGDTTVSTEIFWQTGGQHHEIERHDRHGKLLSTMQQRTQSSYLDPRTRPWYQLAVKSGKSTWADIYNYTYAKKGITLVVPIHDNRGKIISVLGFVVSLDYLNDFISNQKIARNGYSFIVSAGGDLIAYPVRAPFPKENVNDQQLLNVHKVSMPLIDQSLDLYKSRNQDELELKYLGDKYLVSYMPVLDTGVNEWLIGVVVPKSDFTGFLERLNYESFLIVLGIIILGALLLSNLVNRIVRPINILVKETKKIRDFDLEGEITFNSRIQEVVYLKNSLNSMKRGLKHFQKYIPKTLVHQLIETGQDMRIGGVKRNLVVLFSDIENFTVIAEHVDPQQLMVQVCEYFETVTSVIIEEKGTIDKYIGDSVMAFWGAPLVEDEPCVHAARAALACQARLVELNNAWITRGWPTFITRIGIHRGDAIVGNVGSSERLSYTALGDTINITNRLEGINKDYNTKIIVSDTVYQDIKDKFILREVDNVMLKGIARPMKVYELLGDNMLDIKFDIDAFRQEFELGLTTFHQDKYDLALDHFSRCLRIYPDDYLVPKFIRQCQDKLN